MIPRTTLPDALLGLAHRQAGVVSREQAQDFGLSDDVVRRLIRDGLWRRLAGGLYATRDDSWLQRAWAGVLLGGPHAVLGLASAAHLHGLERTPPANLDVFVPHGKRVRQGGPWRFIRSTRAGMGEPARTRVADTVVDLAATLSEDGVVSLLSEAVRGRPELGPRVVEVLAQRARHPHRRLLLQALGDVAVGARSPLEVRFLRFVERPHGLPTPRRQASPTGLLAADAWYEDYGLVVELDGRAHHAGLAAAVDMHRDNLHSLEGIRTLRFTWKHVVGDPCGVAGQVGQALRQAGWSGTLRPCRRCRGRRAPIAA